MKQDPSFTLGSRLFFTSLKLVFSIGIIFCSLVCLNYFSDKSTHANTLGVFISSSVLVGSIFWIIFDLLNDFFRSLVDYQYERVKKKRSKTSTH